MTLGGNSLAFQLHFAIICISISAINKTEWLELKSNGETNHKFIDFAIQKQK